MTSPSAIGTSEFPKGDPLDLGTELALTRTRLALDRTQLAWIRTGFAFITAGMAIDKATEVLHRARMIDGTNWVTGSHVTGLVLVIGSTLILLCSGAGYVRMARALPRPETHGSSFNLAVIAMTALVVGVGALLAILAMTTSL